MLLRLLARTARLRDDLPPDPPEAPIHRFVDTLEVLEQRARITRAPPAVRSLDTPKGIRHDRIA
ncbi:MAG: hypothetical protein WCH83_15220 [Alphaproteobacteria bacterium]